MAKNQKKKKGLNFLSGRREEAPRVPDNSIDLTAAENQESDSDLDINELLRKYMPEYRNDGAEPDAEAADPGEIRLEASEAPAPKNGDEDETDLSSLLKKMGEEIRSGDFDAPEPSEEPLLPDSADEPETDGDVTPPEPEAQADPLASLFSAAARAVEAEDGTVENDLSEAVGSAEENVSSLADRWAAAMTDEPEASAEPEPEASEADAANGLFSRILRSSESEAMSGAEEQPEPEQAGGVFSKIRRTVEEEENRQAEQELSDEALLSALDSAFAYPAGADDGDFQVPVSDKPAAVKQDDLIQEYEFDRGDSAAEPEPADNPSFTVSDTNDMLTEDDRIDFSDGSLPSEEDVYGRPTKPVGEEMTDEQVLGLFGEVKPQKKKFSLFRRNKKPKKVPVADDEFLNDDGEALNNAYPTEPVPAAEEPAPYVPEPETYTPEAAIAPEPEPGSGTEPESPSVPYAEPEPVYEAAYDAAEDDTDALIAEATAAIFGKRRAAADGQTSEAGSGESQPDAPAAEGSVEDAVEALWRQFGDTLTEAETPEPAPAEASAEEPEIPAETPTDGFSSAEAAQFEEIPAGPAADVPAEEEAAAPAEPEQNVPADQPLPEAAAAIPADEEEKPAPAAPAEKKEEEAPRRRDDGLPFVRQSKRSAANLTDEELLAWAAETLSEDRADHDFAPAPAPVYQEQTAAPAPAAPAVPAASDAKPEAADVGEEIPDVSAFDGTGGEIPPVNEDSTLEDLETYLAASEKAAKEGETGTWQTPDKPYEEEEFDPTDINLMVAFDLDNGEGQKSGKARAFGDKLAARRQNRDTTVRLDRPEFVDRTQIPTIRKEYRNRSLSLFIRLILCVVFGVLLFLYENIEPVTKLLTGTGMQFGGVLDPRVYPTVYAMVSLQLMLLCCLCAYDEIADGIKAIFSGYPKPESMTALLAFAGILYSAVISRVTVSPDEPVMFNYVVGLASFMTLISAVYRNKREMMNFRIISSKKVKHIVRRLKDDESELETKAFAEAEEACDVMKIEKTDFIDGFFARLQKPDQTTGTFMMFVMGATVLLALIIGIIDRARGGAAANVARTIYGSLLMLSPLSIFISFSYPFYRANVTAKDYDSAIIGETSLDEYSNASIISFDDKNVFPSYSVKVQNVRIYNNARIDRVLYYASSVFACAGGPLQDVFEDVTKDLGTSSNVKIFETEDDFLATQVDGVNIIFGGCEKLRSRGFVIEDEAAQDDVDFSDELSIMYMFRENKLVAKMYIKYEMDSDIDSILKQFSGNGLYACVRTFDPNISEEMVAKKLSMKKMPLKIVRYADLDEVMPYEAKVDSGLVTCGQQKSLLQVIAYCGKVLRTKKTHIALSVLAVLITAAIVIILELADLLGGMNSLLVTLYQLVWLIPTMITSRVFIR